jgi:lipopolysaccharide export system protein LptA
MSFATPATADLIDEPEVEPTQPQATPVPTAPPAPTPTPTLEKDSAPAASDRTSIETKASQPTDSDRVGLKPKAEPKKTEAKDVEQPVRFQSEGAKGARSAGTIELMKNVEVTQGSLKLNAENAKVFFDEATNEVAKIVATGNVRVSRIEEDSGQEVKAAGDSMVFYSKTRRVELVGNAKFSRGKDLLQGTKMTYELDTGWIWADKVTGVVSPAEQ